MIALRALAVLSLAFLLVAPACSGDKNSSRSDRPALATREATVVPATSTATPAPTETPTPPAPTETPLPPTLVPPTPAPRPATQPSLSLSPNPVRVGGNVIATGSGFAPNNEVTVTGQSGALSLTLGTTRTDARGSFSVSEMVPAFVPPGSYAVVAVDATRNMATSQITVTR